MSPSDVISRSVCRVLLSLRGCFYARLGPLWQCPWLAVILRLPAVLCGTPAVHSEDDLSRAEFATWHVYDVVGPDLRLKVSSRDGVELPDWQDGPDLLAALAGRGRGLACV